jgi:peptidoglycan/LPS O-acetylase OafA/YrhL
VNPRFYEIDGIRGWAAVAVVLFHIFWEIFGVTFPAIRNPVTGFLIDGHLAVSIFFVLSGEALSSSYFAGRGQGAVARLAIKRYPRLTLPILISCLAIFALSQANLVFNTQAAEIVGRENWLGTFLDFPLTLSGTVKYSLVNVFTQEPRDMGAVNPFLWSMKVELIGSLLVFASLSTLQYFREPLNPLVAMMSLLLLMPMPMARNLACFVAGMIFARLRAQGRWEAIQGYRLSLYSWLVITALGSIDGTNNWLEQGYEYKPFFAIPIVAAIFASKPMCNFFSSRLSRFLGRISFPLYLLQFPILISLTSWMIIELSIDGQLSIGRIFVIAFATVVACVVAAVLFGPVDTLTRWVEDHLTMLVFRRGE